MKSIVLSLWLLVLAAACVPRKTFVANEQVSYHNIQAADTLKGTPSVEKLIEPYRAKLEGTMNEVIGQAAQELTHAVPEGLLGNWAADLIHRQAENVYGKKIDFTLLNQSGLRINSIPKGNVTRSKMYELMPFENRITVLQATGADVEKLFQTVVAKGGWPISHATCEIHPMPNAPLAKNIRIGGEPLQHDKIYTFALPDYIANGGDNTELSGLKRIDLDKLMRDAFIEGVLKEKILDAKLEDRIIVVNH